jgi:hypothetical protein
VEFALKIQIEAPYSGRAEAPYSGRADPPVAVPGRADPLVTVRYVSTCCY